MATPRIAPTMEAPQFAERTSPDAERESPRREEGLPEEAVQEVVAHERYLAAAREDAQGKEGAAAGEFAATVPLLAELRLDAGAQPAALMHGDL